MRRAESNEPRPQVRFARQHGVLSYLVLLAALVVAGCAGDLTRNPVPVESMAVAQPPHEPDIRDVGLALSPVLQADLEQSLRDESADIYCTAEDGTPSYCSLALSGGGGFGAFGAGFLNGWTEAGTRPTFKVVTGISTGAMIAPFAFVGPKYDDALKASFTTVSDEDVYTSKSVSAVFGDESFLDSAPLANRIAESVDDELLADVAAAHRAGRRLLIGTANMDRQESVVWNMGAIASSGDPDAPELFRKVLLASASMPGIFPTTLIDVEADGLAYDEMHGDGGLFTPVFFHSLVVDPIRAIETVSAEDGRERPTQGRLFVIRHDVVRPQPQQIDRRLKPVIRRAISTMVKSMSLANLYFIYIEAQAANTEFNYVSLPQDFVWQSDDEFDNAEMNRLYGIGYDMAKAGHDWQKTPPQFDQSPLARGTQSALGGPGS